MTTDLCTTIQIEGTTRCNAKCRFCPVGFVPLERDSGEMDDALFHKIVREGMDMGVREFLLFLNGEPLMDRRFFPWLDYLKERGLTSTLFTNGSLLTRAKADQLATYAGTLNSITFSFHGGDPETYKKVMALNFDKTRANIDYFLNVNQDRIPTRIYLLDYEDTSTSVDAFKAMWGDHAFVSQAYFTWGGLTVSQRAKALEHPPLPCQRLLHHLVILQSGQVALCCMDYHGVYDFGNVRDEPLAVIWERIQGLRERHKRHDFDMDLCRDCSLNRYGV